MATLSLQTQTRIAVSGWRLVCLLVAAACIFILCTVEIADPRQRYLDQTFRSEVIEPLSAVMSTQPADALRHMQRAIVYFESTPEYVSLFERNDLAASWMNNLVWVHEELRLADTLADQDAAFGFYSRMIVYGAKRFSPMSAIEEVDDYSALTQFLNFVLFLGFVLSLVFVFMPPRHKIKFYLQRHAFRS